MSRKFKQNIVEANSWFRKKRNLVKFKCWEFPNRKNNQQRQNHSEKKKKQFNANGKSQFNYD